MFAVTLKIMTHMSVLSGRQITMNRVNGTRTLCKTKFHSLEKYGEIYGIKKFTLQAGIFRKNIGIFSETQKIHKEIVSTRLT